MNLPITGLILDLIVVLFVILCTIRGYKTGFVLRVYSLCITIISYLLAKTLAVHVSEHFVFFELEGYLSVIGQYMNNMIILIILFFIIRLSLKLLNFIIKPILYMLSMKIIFIKQFNQAGGLFFGLIEGFVFAFLALFMIATPLFENGHEIVQQSTISNTIVQIGPDVTNTMMHVTSFFDESKPVTDDSLMSFLNVIEFVYDQGMIQDNLVKTTVNSLFERSGKISTSEINYNKIKESLLNFGYNESQISQWVEKVYE